MAEAGDGLSIAGIVGGAITLLTAIGTGISWVLTRRDRREAAQDARDEALVAKLERRVGALEEETRALWMAISYVMPALQRCDPTDPALRMAAKILGDKFPLDPVTPPDMLATLNKIR